MKVNDMMPMLTAWASRQRELAAQMEALGAVVGERFDGPLYDAVWTTWDSYTDTLSQLIGDNENWLTWYVQENRMGANGLEAAPAGGKPVRVRTLHQLARLIAEGQA
jgi:hypothetical protein